MPATKSGTAKRYAEAVFEIAKTRGSFDRWSEDLDRIARIQRDQDIATLMSAPTVGMSQKEAFLTKALPDASPEAMNLVRILLRRGRFVLASQIAGHYAEILNLHKGIAVAQVTSAVPLTVEELKAVEQRLSAMTGRRVVVESSVDRAILGGIVARIGDQLIDASVRGRLDALKRRLAPA